MDLMEVRRNMMGVIAGMAQSGGFMAHGTYIPETSSSILDLDTGLSGWTRFLMARKQMPNENQTVRGFVLMYIDTNTDFRLCAFNSSGGSQYPNSATAGTLGEYVNKNGSVVVKRGIPSQTGTLEAGIEYEWWCW